MVLRVSGAQGLGSGLEVVDLSFGLGCWGLWTENTRAAEACRLLEMVEGLKMTETPHSPATSGDFGGFRV